MKKIFIIFALLLCFSPIAQAEQIQFRLVLWPAEAKEQNCDRYPDPHFKNKELFISREVLLSNKDLNRVAILNKGSFGPSYRASLYFTDKAKEKLLNITKKYIKRQIAIIVGDKLIVAPVVMEPIESGKLEMLAFTGKDDVEEFIRKLGFAPYLEGDIKNTSDEQDAYRFVKYAMKIKHRNIAEHIILQLYKYDNNSRVMQKLFSEYPVLKKVIPKK